MTKVCNVCQQTFSAELTRCPQCGGQEAVAEPVATSRRGDTDAQIDLGGPVTNPDVLAGPPSGASFVSWTALLEARKNLPLNIPARQEDPVSGTRAGAGSCRRYHVRTALVGFLTGCGFCVGLWFAGFEPPQSLRKRVQTWLYGVPSESTENAPSSGTP